MRYDAFISYRHTDLDSLVAEKLHKKLERYHIPVKYQKLTGKKRINRVFRDREELPLSSNLTESIYEALRESEFLILICSPESLSSLWVNREVSYFAEHHGLNRIITVLIKGEPDEAFPEIIRYRIVETVGAEGRIETRAEEVEPLAADIRGSSPRDTLRKLDREYLRVIATMLSCNYDDLRQRRREYRLRRTMSMLSAALVITLAFLFYAVRQKTIIDQQYLNILESQAKYLSASALQLISKGDRIGALDTLLSLEPYTGEAAKAIVPEQIYGLNQALYSYNRTDSYSSFKPIAAYELESPTTSVNKVSPDNSHFFCLDSQGNAYLFSMPDGILLWRNQLSDLYPSILNDDNAFIDGFFLDDGRLLLLSKFCFYVVNAEDATIETAINSLSEHAFWQGNPIAIHGSTFAVAYPYDSNIYIYNVDPTCDEEPYVIKMGISAYGDNPKFVSSLSFSPSGQSIAVGTKHYNDKAELHGQQSIIVFNLKSGDKRVIACDSVATATFVSDDSLASVQYIDLEDHFDSLCMNRIYSICLYDLEGNVRWCMRDMQMSGLRNTSSCKVFTLLNFPVGGDPVNLIAFSFVNSLIVMDSDRNETVLHHIFDGHIVGIDQTNNNILVGLDDGSVYRHWITSYTRMYSIHSEVKKTLFNSNAFSMVSINSDSKRIVFAGIVEDIRMLPSDVQPADLPRSNAIYEYNGLSATYDRQSSVIRVVVEETDEVWEIPVHKDQTPLYSLFRSNKQLIVYNTNTPWIEIWDTDSRSIIISQYLNTDDSWNSKFKSDLIIDPNGEYFALSYSEGNMYMDINGYGFPELVIYYIDSDCTIYPYAVIPYGAVDFEERIIYSGRRATDTCYEAPFYTYSELIDIAKSLIDERRTISCYENEN